MSEGPVGVALVGAGVISDEYARNLTAFPDVRLAAVADLDRSRAAALAEAHRVPVAGDVDAVLGLDEVEIVLNLTVPAAHASVGLAALEAGKHLYSEKPLALHRHDGERLLAEAATRGLRIGCAPDTVLGASVQSAGRAIAEGLIGAPIAVSAAAMSGGPEAWHPRPEFLFRHGAGPLFDIGPYYLGALFTLFGPATRVAASARQGRGERVVASGPRAGTRFAVEVPTHVCALIDIAPGPSAVATWSFDSAVRRAEIEITGTEGTLVVADPTFAHGPLRLRTTADEDWRHLPMTGATAGRGVGVVDMARALREDRPHRAAADVALHVLDVMTEIAESAERMEFRTIGSTCVRPAPLPPDWDPLAATTLVRPSRSPERRRRRP